jgi:hypothetical protein
MKKTIKFKTSSGVILENIKLLIMDCDGVIFDSNKLKEEA